MIHRSFLRMPFYCRPNTSNILWDIFSTMRIDPIPRRRFVELRSSVFTGSIVLALRCGIALGRRLRDGVVPGHLILVLKSCVA